MTQTHELFGRDVDFYLEADLKEIKRHRASLRPVSTDGKLLSIREASRVVGFSETGLRDRRHELGLTTEWKLTPGKDGKSYWQIALRRDELETLRAGRTRTIATDRLTTKAAAKRMSVSPTTVREWADAVCPYLGRTINRIEDKHGRHLFLRADIEAVRLALRSNGPPAHVDNLGQTWLPIRMAARRFCKPVTTVVTHGLQGRIASKEIEAHDRWSKRGKRRVYLETSLQDAYGAAKVTRRTGALILLGANRNTAKNERPIKPLPQQPYPVRDGELIGHVKRLADKLCAEASESECPVVLGGTWNEPVLVNGKEKTFDNFGSYQVIKALVESWPKRLLKDALESVNGNARRILSALRNDEDWAAAIRMPGSHGKGHGYGVSS